MGDLAGRPARPEEERGPPRDMWSDERHNLFPGPEVRPKNVHAGATVVSSSGLYFRRFPLVAEEHPMAGARKMFLKRKSSAGAGFSCLNSRFGGPLLNNPSRPTGHKF